MSGGNLHQKYEKLGKEKEFKAATIAVPHLMKQFPVYSDFVGHISRMWKVEVDDVLKQAVADGKVKQAEIDKIRGAANAPPIPQSRKMPVPPPPPAPPPSRQSSTSQPQQRPSLHAAAAKTTPPAPDGNKRKDSIKLGGPMTEQKWRTYQNVQAKKSNEQNNKDAPKSKTTPTGKTG